MSENEWRIWWVILISSVMAAILTFVGMVGCSAPEERRPIDFYRAAYGFSP